MKPRRADTFGRTGLHLLERYLAPAECERLLRAVADFRRTRELPVIYRPEPARALNYMVIDGHLIHEHLPQLGLLYRDVHALVREVCGARFVPVGNRAATVNVNITPPAGEYRWHYDRNAVTAILFLNEVEAGEIEMYPNYRLHLGRMKHTRWQRRLDALLRARPVLRLCGRRVTLAPRAGLLLIMRGDKCLHSVRPVAGARERINLVMTFDVPGAVFPQQQDLDPYLYSRKPGPAFDPNYRE